MSALNLLSAHDLALVDAVARRVVELLDQRAEMPPTGLVNAQRLAQTLGVSRSTVYEHAAELGAVQVGGGSRPRLRFDPEKALEAWSRRSGSKGSQAPQTSVAPSVRRRRRSAPMGSGVRLLPVGGQSEGRRAVS
jgi:hypothetical protein